MKRLSILALCLCVLMGTMTVPSFATDTEVAYLEDTFESATVGTTGNSYSSSVLAKGMATMKIVAGMGFDGSIGYNIKADGITSTDLATKNFTPDATSTTLIEYKINVKSVTSGSPWGGVGYKAIFTINKNSTDSTKWNLGSSSGGSVVAYDLNRWYTVVTKVKAGEAPVSYFFDDAGAFVDSRSNSGISVTAGSATWAYLLASGKNPSNIVIDDVKIYTVAGQGLTLKSSSVADGAESAVVGNYVDLTFNQPLSALASGAITLTSGGSSVEASVANIGNVVRITPKAGFAPSTAYEINITSPAALLGATYSGDTQIAFTTIGAVTYLEDTFESATVGTKGNSYTTSSAVAKGMATMEIVAGMGFDGSVGYNIKADGITSTDLATKSFTPDATSTTLIEYKINVKSITSGNAWAGVSSKPIFYVLKNSTDSTKWDLGSSSQGSRKAHDLNRWYSVVTKVKVGEPSVSYFFDDTGALVDTRSRDITLTAGSSTSMYLLAAGRNTLNVVIDDVKVYTVSGQGLTLKSSSVADGAESAVVGNYVDLTFNQPLNALASGAITLTSGGNAVEASVAAIGNVARVTPKTGFASNTNYEINIVSPTALYGTSYTGDKQITFKTSRGLICIEDNFESAVAGTQGTSYSSTLLKAVNNPGATISATAGFEGSKGLLFNTTGTDALLYAQDIPWDSVTREETIVLEYKLKVNSLTSGATWIGSTTGSITMGWTNMKIVRSGDVLKVQNSEGSDPMDLATGKWYTMVLKFKKGAAAESYLYDETGTEYKTRTAGNKWESGTLKIYPFAPIGTTMDAVVDDFKLYYESGQKLGLKSSSVANGQAEVNIGEYIELTFNQPLASNAASKIALYTGEEKVNATVTRVGASVIRIKPATLLKGETTYTVKFDDSLTSLTGNASDIENISFTTDRAYPVEITQTTLAISGNAVNSGSYTISFDNKGEAAADVKVVVALYSGDTLDRLIGCEIFDVTVAKGASTPTVTLANSYSGVGRVKILTYESLKTMKSAAFGYVINE